MQELRASAMDPFPWRVPRGRGKGVDHCSVQKLLYFVFDKAYSILTGREGSSFGVFWPLSPYRMAPLPDGPYCHLSSGVQECAEWGWVMAGRDWCVFTKIRDISYMGCSTGYICFYSPRV